MRRFVFLLCFFAAIPAAAQPVSDDGLACLAQTAKYEKKEKIQTNLLSSVALVESGRYSEKHKTGVAWPWTVGALKKGTFYDTKAQAVAAVEKLRAQGVENIDVGCMQINLKYHPDAFRSLDEAFDPQKNVAYAAKYLKSLYDETKSWGAAATRYHSKSAGYAFRYEDKLLDTWRKLLEFGNPAAPFLKYEQTRAPLKNRKDFFTLPRRPIVDKKEPKTIFPGSEESKKIAREWRRKKLEKYRAGKKPSEEKIDKKETKNP